MDTRMVTTNEITVGKLDELEAKTPVGNPLDIESHIECHQGCPRCAGVGEIPDDSADDGGTRLCPGA